MSADDVCTISVGLSRDETKVIIWAEVWSGGDP